MSSLRLLACFAHPDDEAFTASGVLACCTGQGATVHLLCATCGEEGDIRTPGSATRDTLGQVRHQELGQSCRVLGIQTPPIILGYRDSGWGDSPAQYHPQAFVQAPAQDVIGRLVAEIRRLQPQVVVTFEPDGVSGHKDHQAICRYTTAAFHQAGEPGAFSAQIQQGLFAYRPQRLYYVARPQGHALRRALRLRQAGVDVPFPEAKQQQQGIPLTDIHLTLDVRAQLPKKIASMRAHRTQVPPDWPYLQGGQDVLDDMHGTEYLLRAYPPVPIGASLPQDLFSGIRPAQSS